MCVCVFSVSDPPSALGQPFLTSTLTPAALWSVPAQASLTGHVLIAGVGPAAWNRRPSSARHADLWVSPKASRGD